MKLHKERIAGRITALGKAVFNVSDPDETIASFESFYQLIGSPIRMHEVGINPENKIELLEAMLRNKVNGNHHLLTDKDRERLVEMMFKV
jgi:alcohol dehydrogenase YqhD (iron-dependent ADH family)